MTATNKLDGAMTMTDEQMSAAITACALMIKGICLTKPRDEWTTRIEARIRFMLNRRESPVAPAQSGEPKDWRVGLLYSSSNPRKQVRVLADGAAQIAGYERHHSFVRWIDDAAPQPAQTAQSAVVLDDERAAFEAWAKTKNMDLTPFDSTFDSDFTSNAWDGWQARAGSPQPVAQTERVLTDEHIAALRVAADALIERYAAPIREILANTAQPANGDWA